MSSVNAGTRLALERHRRHCYAARVRVDPLRRDGTAANLFEKRRVELMAEIAEEVRDTSRYLGKDALDPRVMAALSNVPRHAFVPAESAALAYENVPLPIGHGQTISQPYIVAVMTDMLAPHPDDMVLEIGTGCGYQAAVLAELVKKVYSIEYVPALAQEAAERLKRLGYHNIETRAGDGWLGWPEAAPFDGIIVTAAAPRIPRTLVAQLKPGRRMVVPVGEQGGYQVLTVVEKSASGEFVERATLPVAFVPMLGGTSAPSGED